MMRESMESTLTRFSPPGGFTNAHLLDLAKRIDSNRRELEYLEGLFIERLIVDLTDVKTFQEVA